MKAAGWSDVANGLGDTFRMSFHKKEKMIRYYGISWASSILAYTMQKLATPSKNTK